MSYTQRYRVTSCLQEVLGGDQAIIWHSLFGHPKIVSIETLAFPGRLDHPIDKALEISLELISKPTMAYRAEAISHRRRARFGKKQLIVSRSTLVHLLPLRRFFLESGAALDCARFCDEF